MAWLDDLASKAELLKRQAFINLLGAIISQVEQKTPEELKILIEEQKRLSEEIVNITANSSLSPSEIIAALRAYCENRLKNIQHMLVCQK